MDFTSYHAKFYAYELTKRCATDSMEKLAGALVDAQVDLNPHQVDAALFAFHSPLSKGAILADEVGFGKTIEAGLVISQRWARLAPVCHRTLRRQVLPYVRFTKRLPIVQPFTPEAGEDRLYDLVSEYLCRDNLQALPASQRSLMTLVLRKLLASSTFAIAGALDSLCARLQKRLDQSRSQVSLEDEFDQDYEAFDETADEWTEEPDDELISPTDRRTIENEIADLQQFRDLAVSITHNAKGRALLVALDRAFREADRLRAKHKAIIFTESRRTQDYLHRVLLDSPYSDGIVLFNGSNTDARSREIYAQWLEQHAGTDRVTGSRTADMRSALVDYFREEGRIMIATEAGAEGINLPFCSLVVNYDLPWNPQRIEQRIGRCHRYGQQHDVVVVNFINQNNAADQRVFQLLSEKFQLFEGVFGAGDEVLGAIESGVDFERRIADIYRRCRRPEAINTAFDQLQLELGAQINAAMTRTRQQLFEHFDDEVGEKLRVQDETSRVCLNRYEQMLMRLTRYELNHRSTRRRALFDAQDEIDRRRGELIEEIEGKLTQRTEQSVLFFIRWRLL